MQRQHRAGVGGEPSHLRKGGESVGSGTEELVLPLGPGNAHLVASAMKTVLVVIGG